MSVADVLPEELLETILDYCSTYNDYKNCKLVCKKWKRIVEGVAKRKLKQFYTSISHGKLRWKKIEKQTSMPTIADRYSHSACFLDNYVYVFGGCTANLTTFNDLWKFDMSDRAWIRPEASGSYPSPKACASVVCWNKILVVFGGWSHFTPIHLYQPPQFYNHLHIYNTESNTWVKVNTEYAPTPVAGHSACVLNNLMLVYGGSHAYGTSTSDLWSFDLVSLVWTKIHAAEDSQPWPSGRYGAFMCALNSKQALILGGCGGPNMLYNDSYILTVHSAGTCTWAKLSDKDKDGCCPPLLWYHPICKVGSKLVLLSKTNTPVPEKTLYSISSWKSLQFSKARQSKKSSADHRMKHHSVGAGELKRNLRLAALDRSQKALIDNGRLSQRPTLLKEPMFVHTIDISNVSEGYITWCKPNVVDVSGQVPEETYFYSLVEGVGELMMFGGIESSQSNTMQRPSLSDKSTMNDSVFLISAL